MITVESTPNVPLIGLHGGISYNPCLALHQFGRARREGPHDRLGFLQSLVNWDLGFTVPFVVWSLSSPAKRLTNASPCLATSASSVSFPLHGWIKLIRGMGNDFAFAFFRSLEQMSDFKPHGLIHDYYYVFCMKCEQNEQKNSTFNLGDEERRRLGGAMAAESEGKWG